MAASQSKLSKLHELFIAELTTQIKTPEVDESGKTIRPTAALLTVIGNTLSRAGVRPTDDSPSMAQLRRNAMDLPFTNTDEHGLPTSSTH